MCAWNGGNGDDDGESVIWVSEQTISETIIILILTTTRSWILASCFLQGGHSQSPCVHWAYIYLCIYVYIYLNGSAACVNPSIHTYYLNYTRTDRYKPLAPTPVHCPFPLHHKILHDQHTTNNHLHLARHHPGGNISSELIM